MERLTALLRCKDFSEGLGSNLLPPEDYQIKQNRAINELVLYLTLKYNTEFDAF